MSIQYSSYNLAGARFGPFGTHAKAEAFRARLGLSGPIVQEV